MKLGSAFDVVGERAQVDFTVDTKARWMEEEIEVEAAQPQGRSRSTCMVKENLYPLEQLEVMTNSQDFTKEDARTIPSR